MKLSILPTLLITFLFTFSAQTFALDFTVNVTTEGHDANTLDTICDTNLIVIGEQCTLRAAIDQANALSSNDRILFSLPANSTVTLTSASGPGIPIQNNGTLEIIGTGANTLTIGGGFINRIFYINQATVTITDLTLKSGHAGNATINNGQGGAIYADNSNLTFDRVHVTGNYATNGGGAYFNGGTYSIRNSTFSLNNAIEDCAGFNQALGVVTVVNSTISGNVVYATAEGAVGGGICAIQGSTVLRNATITNNRAGQGGGIHIFQSSVSFANSIIAGNYGATNSPDINFIFWAGSKSLGYNLFGVWGGLFTQSTDIFNTQPMLEALANNGGPTPTHALLTNSPVIDKGNSFGETTDQRGFVRSVDLSFYPNTSNGDAADIGAYERQAVPSAASVVVSGRVITAQSRGIRNVIVKLVDEQGETRTAITTSFGYFRFADIPAGQSYTISVSGKRYSFTQPAQVLNLTGDTDDINFVADN